MIKIKYKTQNEALAYYDWITETGVSCAWDFDKQHMLVDFVHEVDATAFKLRFGI